MQSFNMQSDVIDFEKIDKLLNVEGKNKKNYIDAKLNSQRENRVTANNKRQELLGTLAEKYNKRIDKIHSENVKNNHKKLEANYQKAEQTKQNLENHKTIECHKNINKLKMVKAKDIKSQQLLAKIKDQRLREKQKRDIERYYKKVEYQKITLVKNQQLIEKCLETKTLDDFENIDQEWFVEYEEEISYEPMEEINEEECNIIDSDQSKLEMICKQTNLDNCRVYLERIAMLKKNINSCEAGRHFLQKTGPIWDSLTQCVYRKSLILENMAKNSDNTMNDDFRKIYDKTNFKLFLDTSFLDILITDLNYDLTDEDVYNAMKKAKEFTDESTTALEIMNLVKLILEYEIDVKENVLYIINGVCRRTVFEHTKKRISYRMLGRSKNTINRLQFLNTINLIPKEFLITKNSEKYVEPIVFDFITNDIKYGYLTAGEDTITEDNMYPKKAQKKMEEFSRKLNFCYIPNIYNRNYENIMDNIFEMPEKYCLENHADTQVDRLMAFVHKQLASHLSKSYTPTYNNITDVGELTHTIFNILARKMTKMILGMGGPYEEKIYVLEAIMKNIVIEIAKRSPKVQYKHRKRGNIHKAVAEELEFNMSNFYRNSMNI